MFKNILVLLLTLLVISTTKPVSSGEQTFIAGYCNPGANKLTGWKEVKPNFIRTATDWEPFEAFLLEVKKKAGNRPIILDIDCHGDPLTGMAALQVMAYGNIDCTDEASIGYILNTIEKVFGKHPKHLQVTLELCHAQYCYNKSLKMKSTLETEDFHIQPYDHVPSYPVYGISCPSGDRTLSPANYNNYVLISLLTSKDYIHDLREDADKDVKVCESKEQEKILFNKLREVVLYLLISPIR